MFLFSGYPTFYFYYLSFYLYFPFPTLKNWNWKSCRKLFSYWMGELELEEGCMVGFVLVDDLEGQFFWSFWMWIIFYCSHGNGFNEMRTVFFLRILISCKRLPQIFNILEKMGTNIHILVRTVFYGDSIQSNLWRIRISWEQFLIFNNSLPISSRLPLLPSITFHPETENSL